MLSLNSGTRTAASSLQQALVLVSLGLALLPLRPKGKGPYFDLLPCDNRGNPSWRLLGHRVASESDVKNWFRHDPNTNIGIITGKASGGLIVIDIDVPTPPPLHLPPTVCARTGRGTHYYYRSAVPVQGFRLPWGDVKAEGGYVVSPPSIHPTGKPYEWVDFCSPSETGIAMLPTDLSAELRLAAIGAGSKPVRGSKNKDHYPCFPQPASGEHPCARSLIHAWAKNEDVAAAILSACGAKDVTVGRPFLCPLPGHDERSPSATLWRQPDGRLGFHDWHRRDGHEWYNLAEVYASVLSGKVTKLGEGEAVAWFIRALAATGFVTLPHVEVPPLPQSATEPVQAVYRGFALLRAVRAHYDPEQCESPFSWRFAERWVGLSQRRCGEAIQWLVQNGYLSIATPGTNSKPTTYTIPSPFRHYVG